MPGPEYAQVALENAIVLDDTPRSKRRSLDETSDGSDIVYRDALDDEPFQDEKLSRFDEEGRMEDGDEDAEYLMQARRVRTIRTGEIA
jgi:hypothetical protein